MTNESRKLGITLPSPPEPIASCVTYVRSGNLVYTPGHGPLRVDGTWVVGRVGADLTIEEAAEAALVSGLGLIATLRNHLGSLDAVSRVVKLMWMVNCHPEFVHHPAVINGCSDLLAEVLAKRVGTPGPGRSFVTSDGNTCRHRGNSREKMNPGRRTTAIRVRCHAWLPGGVGLGHRSVPTLSVGTTTQSIMGS